jgi:hypothetical protein
MEILKFAKTDRDGRTVGTTHGQADLNPELRHDIVEIVPVDEQRASLGQTARFKEAAIRPATEVAQDEDPKGCPRIGAPFRLIHGRNELEIKLPE